MPFKMEIYHLPDIHSVYVIRPENNNEFRVMLLYQADILKNRISRPLKPFRSHTHLWWNNSDKVVFDYRRQRPVHSHMLDKRLGFILNEKIDSINMGIDEIT
jgi:hypothetical protein